MHTFEELRKDYQSFVFRGFEDEYTKEGLEVRFFYEIPRLETFTTRWVFPAGEKKEGPILERLLFALGMVEGISYYKCACPPELVYECGSLSDEAAGWWRELYFNGLGEFLYINGIDVPGSAQLVREFTGRREEISPIHDSASYSGILVPVGGGKDSVVSLEVLGGEDITAYTVNAGQAQKSCIESCSHCRGHLNAKRILDKKILEMNEKGYLNGHIPFSAVLAFSAYITAYLNGIKYIALSNENSANESTVRDSKVNHQYSKSYEFEVYFRDYVKALTDSDIYYFSLLRPLSELQIAAIFSKKKQYHRVFRSCNAGSKKGIWCGRCAKCMFVYIILSPFLSIKELDEIFGRDLLDCEDMDRFFCELSGIDENKPFECVGTRAEVLACLGAALKGEGADRLLLNRHRDFIEKNAPSLPGLLGEWNEQHGVPEAFAKKIRAELA